MAVTSRASCKYTEDNPNHQTNGTFGPLNSYPYIYTMGTDKNTKPNPDEVYLFNIRMKDIQDIIKLVVVDSIDIFKEGYDRKKIMIEGLESKGTPHNMFQGGKHILIRVPLDTSIEGYSPSFEIKIYEDGFVSYENGNGCMMRYPNFYEVAEIVNERIK